MVQRQELRDSGQGREPVACESRMWSGPGCRENEISEGRILAGVWHK